MAFDCFVLFRCILWVSVLAQCKFLFEWDPHLLYQLLSWMYSGFLIFLFYASSFSQISINLGKFSDSNPVPLNPKKDSIRSQNTYQGVPFYSKWIKHSFLIFCSWFDALHNLQVRQSNYNKHRAHRGAIYRVEQRRKSETHIL